MNVLTLPDEMLANVLKFYKFDRILKLRKLNSQMNRVAVRYGLSEPIVRYIRATKDILFFKYKDTRRLTTHVFLKCSDVPLMFGKKLNEVHGLSTIDIDSHNVDKTMLKDLKDVKQKHRINVEFSKCTFKISVEDLRNVVRMFKSAKFIITAKSTVLGEDFVSDKMLCSLLPNASIYCESSRKHQRSFPALTDKTLHELQRSMPTVFQIGCHFTNFTIPQIIQIMKGDFSICLETANWINWALGCVRVDTREEVLLAERKFRAIQDVRVRNYSSHIHVEVGNVTRSCQVRIVHTSLM